MGEALEPVAGTLGQEHQGRVVFAITVKRRPPAVERGDVPRASGIGMAQEGVDVCGAPRFERRQRDAI